MKKVLGGKTWSAVCIALVIMMLAGIAALGIHNFVKLDMIKKMSVCIEGEYSVDGGEFKPIDNEKPINEQFDKIVFRGTLPDDVFEFYDRINISSKNVWYSLKTEDGQILSEHKYVSREELLGYVYESYISVADDPHDPMLDKDYFFEHYQLDESMANNMPDTPGYCSFDLMMEFFIEDGITKDTPLILEVENPYPHATFTFSESMTFSLSEANGIYQQFFFDVLPALLIFVLVCFFGIFLFPIAGFVLGKINYKYLTFGALCFVWGLFMIVQFTGGYLNYWILEPTVCMAIEVLMNHCLVIMILFYLKSNLERGASRAIANVTATVYIIAVIVALILHFSFVIDLYASSLYIFIITLVCTVIMTILLFIEANQNKQAVMILVSWTPLALSVILDAFDHYLHFTSISFYHIGLAVTMLYQIVQLVIDMRRQYLASIHYQQMQKELYEAKVGVMVSQIQPHFMYNALTSIAMMCTIDPETAQEATVTFAKYLRGNMDSLKQTKPIPFAQELEHLKKYLYIEKLRFGKKLNIVYDIRATDFVLPQLSIQPLVENAVKHGVGMKKKGGTVTIAARETDTAYEVIVSDDGVGFDTTAEPADDGRSHVGMDNTRRRIEEMCGGKIVIESVIGEGTVVTVILPKDKQGGNKDENTVS